MNSRDRNALRTDIGKMSTRKLEAELNRLYAQKNYHDGRLLEAMESGAYDAAEESRWAMIDLINDEIRGRQHDIEDPSSGLSLHQPS